ncbi:hypothetical protein GCM10023169_01670 [Georgenia halophila]|uniref:F5/8 type C domain-containing protein n=2 Tax=Georgenia halophila TaxID=620889 RepID=A0ABP8KUL0_9MICO
MMAAALVLVGGLGGGMQQASGPLHGAGGEVTFALEATPGNDVARGTHHLQLRCDGDVEASARLHVPNRATVTERRSADAESDCVVRLRAPRRADWVNEVMLEVRSAASGAVVHRATAYETGELGGRSFRLPAGDVEVRLSSSLLEAGEVGTALSVMSFNILHGGRLDEVHEHGFEQRNIAELLEFVRHEDPDVLFTVETYGTGDEIVEALNTARSDDKVFTGVQITREPGQAADEDNLWMFTHLPVEEVYPSVAGDHATSFNFGGARLGLPDGRHVHAFSMWLSHRGNAWSPVTRTAMENALGLETTSTEEELLDTDRVARLDMANEILDEHLPSIVQDDAPVIIAGDANALSPLDWSAPFADAPGHEGLTLEWPVMSEFREAGFADTYRHANPDAGRFPGRTWSAGFAYTYAPARIDYILTRGEDVRVLASSTRDRRLPEQRGSALDDIYPFYSDHAAVVSELLVRGTGAAPSGDYEVDEPVEPYDWPAAPDGVPVPPSELSATASNESSPAALAVDGDARTHWHSNYQLDPPPPLPHELTVDMGSVRSLTGLRYQPRINGFNGIVTEYTVEASTDGTTFTEVASGTWDRSQIPSNVELPGVEARYLRLVVHEAVGLFSSAAELTPYEVTKN